MTTARQLTTEAGLREYLKERSIEAADVTLLTGGTANFVYRVARNDGTTVIYKHAAPYLHSNTDFAFDPIRMDYEERALCILPPLLSANLPGSKVHPAERCSYDQEAKLLCIEDGGENNLKTAYSDPKLDIPEIGRELGKWIAALHLCSRQTSLSLSNAEDLEANNAIAVNIYRYSYNNLSSALSEFGHDAKFGERINDEFGSKLAVENETVCHGDFWPGNVLVKFRDAGNKDLSLTVVDWEMVRRGTSATDVGQFAAEAFMLDRFRGGRGLLPAFLDGYLEATMNEGKIGREWVQRMAVHCGVHLAFWPTRVAWTDRAGTQELVDIGVRLLNAAVDGDFGQLRASELLKEGSKTWDNVFSRA